MNDNLSLRELLDQAKARNEQQDNEEKQNLLAEKKLDEMNKAELVAGARKLLPEALRNCVVFEGWHKQNYEFRELWNATVLILVHGIAPIRMFLYAKRDQLVVDEIRLYGSTYGHPFEVLNYHAKNNDGWYVQLGEVQSANNIEEALQIAITVGDNKEEIEKQVQELKELNAKPFKPEPERVKVLFCPLIQSECKGDQCAWWIPFRGIDQCAIRVLGSQSNLPNE